MLNNIINYIISQGIVLANRCKLGFSIRPCIIIIMMLCALYANRGWAQVVPLPNNFTFTKMTINPNYTDENGENIIKCDFNLRIKDPRYNPIKVALSIECPKGTLYHDINGNELYNKSQVINTVAMNSNYNGWLGFIKSKISPLPGTNTYYARLSVISGRTRAIEAQSKYIPFTMTGEQSNAQEMSSKSNIPQQNSTLFQDNILSAHRGDAEAQTRVGVAYIMGDGISINHTEAVSWFRKAAQQGSNTGQYELGLCYENGIGVSKDMKQAVYWYRKSAEQGNPQAQSDLANCYFGGNGVDKDYSKAYDWGIKAANQGNVDAHYIIGCLYAEGLGVKQDQKAAVSWFKKAAEKGHVASQGYLGFCYYTGQGVEQDEKTGLSWLKKAADQGEKQSQNMLAEIEKEKKAGELTAKTESEKSLKVDVDCDVPTIGGADKHTYAVIIGNEKYKNVDEVAYAENDAKVFKEYIEKTIGVPGSQINYIENAGYNDIRSAVKWLRRAMEISQGLGRAIFYYAGHGIPSNKDKTAYLLPVDGICNDIESAYSLSLLFETLGNVPSKSVTIFLDACFSGSLRDKGMIVKARGIKIKPKIGMPTGNTVVFSASQNDEAAYPYKSKHHGIFTYFLLKKIRETNGNVSFKELEDYLKENVIKTSFTEYNDDQTPVVTPSSEIGKQYHNLKLK